MLNQTIENQRMSSSAATVASTMRRPAWDNAGLQHEEAWRQPHDLAEHGPIVASRWTDARITARQERNIGAADRYVVGVALRPVRARIGCQAAPSFEGTLSTGAIHLTAPGATAEAAFFSPCDFVHFHVTAAYFRDRQQAAAIPETDPGPSLHDLVVHDELAANLSRTLTNAPGNADPLYAESVGRTILMRVLAQRRAATRISALSKWRLRRVHEHLAVHLADPIRLADLAAAAGLSRMHFAAQFKAATGCRPHDFVLQHRIEAAKTMLAERNTSLVEVALDTGFQTQSHFSTVFKRLVGETPGRWQRAQRQG